MENKQHPKKGLSDKELAHKYEAGKINLSEVLKPALKSHPSTTKMKARKGN